MPAQQSAPSVFSADVLLLPSHEQDLLGGRGRFAAAIERNDLATASSLLQEHGREALVHAQVRERESLLHVAIKTGREELVRWLLENGAWLSDIKYPWVEPADPSHAEKMCEVGNHVDENKPGFDELRLACERGHLGIVKYLIEKGADPQGWDDRRGPLASAVKNGHLAVVRHLLQIGAQVRYWVFDAMISHSIVTL